MSEDRYLDLEEYIEENNMHYCDECGDYVSLQPTEIGEICSSCFIRIFGKNYRLENKCKRGMDFE